MTQAYPPPPAAYAPGPAVPPAAYPLPAAAPPQAAPQGYNPYAGADQAAYTVSTPNIPLGDTELEFVRYERTQTSSGKEFVFITYKVLKTDNPSVPVGSECAVKQNMNPAGKGGRNIAFGALKQCLFPTLGYSLLDPAHVAHVKMLCDAGHFSAWLLEIEARGTVAGKPVAGRKVRCIAQAGTRKANTPPDKEPFPRQYWTPLDAPIA